MCNNTPQIPIHVIIQYYAVNKIIFTAVKNMVNALYSSKRAGTMVQSLDGKLLRTCGSGSVPDEKKEMHEWFLN